MNLLPEEIAQQQAALDAAQNEYESVLADGIVPGAIQQDEPVPGDAFDPNDPSTWPYGVEWNPVNPEFSPENFWNNSGDPMQQGLEPSLIEGFLGPASRDPGRPTFDPGVGGGTGGAPPSAGYGPAGGLGIPRPGPGISPRTPVGNGAGRAPRIGQPNSIYEQIGPDGKVRSRTFHDDNGRQFARQDFDRPHAGVQPHEHLTQFDAQGNPLAPERWRPLPQGYDNTPTK